MTRPTFDTNADFTPRIVGITTNRHNFGLPASLCAAVAKPQDDKPAQVSIWINAAACEIFFVLTLESWNEMQRQLEAKVREWAHTDQPASFSPGDYADSAERQHLVAQLAQLGDRNIELSGRVKELTTQLETLTIAREILLKQVETLRAWKEKVTSIILHEILVD